MFKIKIFSPGKTKEPWLRDALAEYEKRLRGEVSIEWMVNCERVQKEGAYICLDVEGEDLTSPEFSKFLYKKFERGGSRLNIVIGGPEGVPEELRKNATECISFSKLTFTHQMIRVILLEQIYRAVQIEKGSGYHRAD
ncbi:MAG: Ribosomal RNA large subunit methyltransferase H [Chlamydiae bacterium]|nr:Ribosomal RNA large subunit methyltransferase H [Chlamydiota bacterium]